MKTQSIKIETIRLDSGTQSRAWTNEEAIADYADRMIEGDKFPPVDIFFDGNEYHLADGFHRVLAACRCEFKDILANIHKGSVQDAIWFAIGANKSNGIKRTAGDKKKAIEIALAKFPDKTQQQIAEHIGCNQSTVARCQSELMQTHKLSLPATRKGKDGKERPTKYQSAKSIRAAAQTTAEEASEPTEPPRVLTAEQRMAETLNPHFEREDKFTKTETKLLEEADVARINLDIISDCIKGHKCQPVELEEVKDQLAGLSRIIGKYMKELEASK